MRNTTFIEQQNDLLEGFHEVDVVVTVLLNPQQKRELRKALCGEGLQKRTVLLRNKVENMVGHNNNWFIGLDQANYQKLP